MRALASRGLAAAIVLLIASAASAQPPQRDAVKPSAVGTASIAGVVLTDDREARPVRRVRVFISTSDRLTSRMTVTDDTGRFNLTSLPAGRYMVTASKQGYVPFTYGARRPGRPGTTIVVADGQRVGNLTLKLSRGSVITGTLVDPNGEPLSNVNVYAMRYVFANAGQRQLVMTGFTTGTDDRGAYRIWGLPAGEYVVAAVATGIGPQAVPSGVEITRITDADVKRGMAAISSGAAQPGTAARAAQPSERSGPGRAVGYATAYYPGTFSSAQATAIKVGVAEERSGVDFALSLVPTARVQGTVAVPEGFNPQQLVMQMIGNNPAGMLLDIFRRTVVAADGSFTFSGVAPGTYTIVVRGTPATPPQQPLAGVRPQSPQMSHYALAEVTVDGQDLSGINLTLQRGMTLSGRIVFEGTTPTPDLMRVRVNLAPVQSQGEVSIGGSTTQAEASGRFTLHGVTPGRYRLAGSVPSARPDLQVWQLKSSLINGRDAADVPIEVLAGTDDVVITLTDRVSELTGIVQDAAGQPAPDYQVIIFPADRTFWTGQSRRIRSLKPSVDGKYTALSLPPGEYLIAAVVDVEPGEWNDPLFLEQLSRAAFKVVIAEGEKKTQDLRVTAQVP